jgi:hypothetical protein
MRMDAVSPRKCNRIDLSLQFRSLSILSFTVIQLQSRRSRRSAALRRYNP